MESLCFSRSEILSLCLSYPETTFFGDFAEARNFLKQISTYTINTFSINIIIILIFTALNYHKFGTKI